MLITLVTGWVCSGLAGWSAHKKDWGWAVWFSLCAIGNYVIAAAML